MKYFPIFADLDKAHVLVVGGGEQAAQKVRLLRKTKARITIVAETVNEELRGLEEENAIWIVLRVFLARDLEGQSLVYAATGDRVLDAEVSRAARPGVSPSTSSMQQSSPPSSCRLSSTAPL